VWKRTGIFDFGLMEFLVTNGLGINDVLESLYPSVDSFNCPDN
jgi:hypothetical protein